MDSMFFQCRYSVSPGEFASHYHDACEILFITSGESTVKVNDNVYRAVPGSMIFINNFEEHSISDMSSDYSHYCVLFSVRMANRYINDARLISVFKSKLPKSRHMILVADPGKVGEIVSIFQTLCAEHRNEEEYSLEMTALLLKQILIIMYRIMPGFFCGSFTETQMNLRLAQMYIDEHYQEDISISDLAGISFLSSFYFSHSFKDMTGYSPKQYLLMSRLSKAKELLLTTDLPVNMICVQCGFQDVNNMIRLFKREFKLTPNQYRKQMHDGGNDHEYAIKKKSGE